MSNVKKYNYREMAELVASKLSKDELIALFELLDADSGHDFDYWIGHEVNKVAPEIFIFDELIKKEIAPND